MNDHTTDHHDALIDRGLAELLGGETPPDLSEKILAATQLTAAQPVTLTQGNATMSTTIKQSSRLKSWAILAASMACIATVIGLLLPTRNAARRLSDHDNLAQVRTENLEQGRETSTDTGIGLRGLINDAETANKSSEELMMATTPHIIIEEGEEEERLGIATEEEQERAGEQGKGGEHEGQASIPISRDKMADMVGEFNDLRDQQRYEEMEAAAKNLYDAAPDHPVAQQVWENAKYIRRHLSESGETHEEGFYKLENEGKGSLAGEQSGDTLHQPSAPLQFESEKWQQLSAPGKKNSSRDLYRSSGRSASDDFGDNFSKGDTSEHQLSTSPDELMIDVQLSLRAISPSAVDGIPIEDVNALIAIKEHALRKKSQLSAKAQRTETDNLIADLAKLREFQRRHYRPASRDQYTPIHENPFIKAIGPDAVSTFSIDVDTASYANVRQYLEQSRQLPPADAVRIEELINYFDYDYAGPTNAPPTENRPFAAHMEVAACPWNKNHRLARIAIKGKEIARDERPQSNLVFLVDVSGSMNEPNKLPLLVEGMKMLTRELGENDRVAIVVYASSEGLALESTRGDEQETILTALDQLRAGGSTAGGAGINLAYQVALDNFIEGGTNRVILCTDGDFNVGVTDTAQLEQLASEKAKTGVFLTVLGFGRGNLNDAMMEGISNKGNGNYHYVDNLTEARKVLVEEMTGTLVTIAKDVKIQVEFNPARVAGYRLIGYENRLLKTEDFNDDKKDAGEIGAGHTVTALYEVVPAGQEVTPPAADPLKYQKPLAGLANEESKSAKPQAASDELLTLKLRYKLPEATESTKLEFPITDSGESFADATDDFQFAAAVASFGMLLRHSQHQGETSFEAVLEIAQSASEHDPHNYRAEFVELVRIAKELSGDQPSSTADPSTTEGP